MNPSNLVVVYDDRLITNSSVSEIVGIRRYGDIVGRHKSQWSIFLDHLKPRTAHQVFRLTSDLDLNQLRIYLNSFTSINRIFYVSAVAGFTYDDLLSLYYRLTFCDFDFIDSPDTPLIAFFCNIPKIKSEWSGFWRNNTLDIGKLDDQPAELTSTQIRNLSNRSELIAHLAFTTQPREFNHINPTEYSIVKTSHDKKKIKGEYLFYHLLPMQMKPWVAPTYGYTESMNESCYYMHRYAFTDASVLWVHNAFTALSFNVFIQKVFHFLSVREKKTANTDMLLQLSDSLFLHKVKTRIESFLASEIGRHVNSVANSLGDHFDITKLFVRYKLLYEKNRHLFSSRYITIGHGDICLSNILYDIHTQQLLLIDPRGALRKRDLWTHPLYDICKLSHSITGNYDYINKGLFRVTLDSDIKGKIEFDLPEQFSLISSYNEIMLSRCDFSKKAIDLGVVSLFLSMLPLHSDNERKVLAFLMNSSYLLDKIELSS